MVGLILVEADGGYKIFEANDGGAVWDLCFPYLDGSDFIYRRCRTVLIPPAEQEIGRYKMRLRSSNTRLYMCTIKYLHLQQQSMCMKLPGEKQKNQT